MSYLFVPRKAGCVMSFNVTLQFSQSSEPCLNPVRMNLVSDVQK